MLIKRCSSFSKGLTVPLKQHYKGTHFSSPFQHGKLSSQELGHKGCYTVLRTDPGKAALDFLRDLNTLHNIPKENHL